MRAAVVVMVVMLAALIGACWARGGSALVVDGLRAGWQSALQLTPLLIVVFLITGLVEVLLPKETVMVWFSDSAGARGYVLAWVAGALTPGGGPVGLPLAAALARQGAGPAVVVTYLTSMALLSFVRVPVELGMLGVRLTILRMVSGLLLPFAAGALTRLLTRLMGVQG